MPPLASSDRYVFDKYQLAADGSLLVCNGVAVPLAPKLLRTLLVLVRHAGHVVSKEDLLSEVWPGTFVAETGLTRNISLLRQALDDGDQRYIVTVPRIGYRFTAAAERQAAGLALPGQPDAAPFVGREKELQRLHAAFGRASQKHGHLVALAGEPGIGKTTIAERFLAEIGPRALVGCGRSSEAFCGAEPHLPVLEALQELLKVPECAPALLRYAPTWAGYLHVGTQASHPPGTGEREAGTPERLLRELTRFLSAISAHRPVVLFLDDVHWSDVATVDALAHLADRARRLRLLVLLTYREHELAHANHAFARVRGELLARGALEEIRVSLLGPGEVSAYVAAARGTLGAPAALTTLVFARSEGNPLFMTALVAYLGEAVGPEREADAWHEVPDSLRGLIARMVARLDADARDLLVAAAVQGDVFDTAVLARAMSRGNAEVEDLLAGVERTHGLIVCEQEETLPAGTPSLRYRFKHAMYRSVLLGTLSPSRRSAVAARLAGALSVEHAERLRDIAGPLAMLFETAREHGRAAELFAVASRAASSRLAFEDADRLAQRGFASLRRAVDLAPADNAAAELALTLARLVPLGTWKGYGSPEVMTLVHRATELAGALGDVSSKAFAMSALCLVRLVRAECAAARDAARGVIEIAEADHNPVLLINAHMQAQIASHHMGRFAEADDHAAAVTALGANLAPEERFINVFDPVVASLAESSRNAWICGRLAQAADLAERAVALGRDVGNLDSLAFAWLFHAWLHGYRGDWHVCLRSAETGMSVARDAGAVQMLAWNRCVRGWAIAHMGVTGEGLVDLDEGIRASRDIMGEVAMPQFRAMLTEAHLLAGHVDEAERCITDALHAGREHDDAYFAAELHRMAARCRLMNGGAERAAIASLHAAIEVAREQGAGYLELRAALDLGGLTGDVTPVRGALERMQEPEPWPEVLAARRAIDGHR